MGLFSLVKQKKNNEKLKESKKKPLEKNEESIDKDRIVYLIERYNGNWSLDKPKDPKFYTGNNCWLCGSYEVSYFEGSVRLCNKCKDTIKILAENKSSKDIKQFEKGIKSVRENIKDGLMNKIKSFENKVEISKEDREKLKEISEEDLVELEKIVKGYEEKIEQKEIEEALKKKEKKLKELRKEVLDYKDKNGIYLHFETWINADIKNRFERFKKINEAINEEVLVLFNKYIERYNDESFFDNLPQLKKLLENKMSLSFNEDEFNLLIQNLHYLFKISLIVAQIQKEKSIENISKKILESGLIDLENVERSNEKISVDVSNENIEILKQVIKHLNLEIKWEQIITRMGELKESIELENFEQKLLRTDKKPSKKEIEKMTGVEFEKFVGGCFENKGYKVKVTKATGDQGADLVLEDEKGVLTAVQVKKYSGSVGNKAVQEVVASMKFYDCDKAMIVTTGTFTKSAFELASKNGVQLIDKKGLDNLI